MATNMVYKSGSQLPLVCTDPATPASGDPVICGQLPGVALAAEDSAGVTTVACSGVFNLSVKGTSGTNAAIAAGDKIFYVSANTPKLSVTTSGVYFGIALDPVTSGATTTIRVRVGA